jgi:glutamate/tyrosine decarboxylase-like PLP-dependent enzyme
MENSRRFRALPVYATLTAYGREGYRDMMERQIQLARLIAQYIHDSPSYELLPEGNALENVYIIVLFRAKDPKLNEELVHCINSMRKIYVSGTQWEGKPAARFAVASWQVRPQREIETIKGVLDEVVK